VERWSVKTLTDKDAASVNLKAKTSSVRAPGSALIPHCSERD
jgi:hypothetical protein